MPVPKLQVIDALAANVMKEQQTVVDFISEFTDKQLGNNHYFEGTVNNNEFSLNCKLYSYNRSSASGIRATPQLTGYIKEIEDGTYVDVIVNGPNPTVWWLSVLLVIIVQALFFSPVILLFSLPIMVVLSFLRRASYFAQMRRDIEQLQNIFSPFSTINPANKI